MVDRSGEVRDIRARNRWLKICLLVIIGLILLAGVGLVLYFFVFNEEEHPHLQFHPEPDKGDLIWFKQSDTADGNVWTDKLNSFLKEYYKPEPNLVRTSCNDNYIKGDPDPTIPCAIDVSTLTECSLKNSGYGYRDGRGTPCVALKLNRIFGWEPVPYTDLKEAQDAGMPMDLIEHIKVLNNSRRELFHRMLNTTWITCSGESAGDQENIGNLGYYYPGFNNYSTKFLGLPNFNFPYLDQDAYLSPFVFVKFMGPQPNVIIRVKCTAWAKNIEPERGSVSIELMMD